MNNSQALTKLRKLLGPNAGFRVDLSAPDAEGRAAAKARSEELRAARDAAAAARDKKLAELTADPEYQRLVAEAKAAREAHQRNASTSLHYPITAGVVSSLFFRVEAQADTWNGIFEALEAKMRKTA